MLENDFIMRQIQMAAQAIARILARRQAGEVREALEEIAGAANELTGIGIEAWVSMPLEAVMDIFTAKGELDGERVATVAHMLKIYGDLLEDVARGAEGRAAHVKAFVLFDELQERGEDVSTHHEMIAELVGQLE